jgi:hypothetical protein
MIFNALAVQWQRRNGAIEQDTQVAFLAYSAVGYAFQFGTVAVNAPPTNLGGTPTLNHFLVGRNPTIV